MYTCACMCVMQAKVGALGGIELVLAAMRAHAGSAAVQEQACGAIRIITANHADNKVCTVLVWVLTMQSTESFAQVTLMQKTIIVSVLSSILLFLFAFASR